MAFAVKNDPTKKFGNTHVDGSNRGQRKDTLFCTHCNYHGHTIEKCYKIHGYPPGFRQRQKNQSNNNQNTTVNQISNQSGLDDKIDRDHGGVRSFFQNLNNTQCQQLMALLSTQLSSTIRVNEQPDVPSTSYTTGTCFSVVMNLVLSSPQFWIVDSGASQHVYSNDLAFEFLRPIQHSTVTLPNQTCIPVSLSGDVRLGSNLLLKDVQV